MASPLPDDAGPVSPCPDDAGPGDAAASPCPGGASPGEATHSPRSWSLPRAPLALARSLWHSAITASRNDVP
eukprot:11066881-Alexandrium_andersonii.AAC.1